MNIKFGKDSLSQNLQFDRIAGVLFLFFCGLKNSDQKYIPTFVYLFMKLNFTFIFDKISISVNGLTEVWLPSHFKKKKNKDNLNIHIFNLNHKKLYTICGLEKRNMFYPNSKQVYFG